MKEIELTQGYKALVDDEDYEWLSQWKWFATGSVGRKYAARYGKDNEGYKARKVLYMHRELMSPNTYQEVDHKDKNTLNNQKSTNLRLCTSQQQNCNSTREVLGIRGVDKRNTNPISYRAKIVLYGKAKYLGTYSSIEKAAEIRDIASVKYYGEFGTLNYPERREEYKQLLTEYDIKEAFELHKKQEEIRSLDIKLSLKELGNAVLNYMKTLQPKETNCA